MPHAMASEQGLHYLHNTLKGVFGLKRANIKPINLPTERPLEHYGYLGTILLAATQEGCLLQQIFCISD